MADFSAWAEGAEFRITVRISGIGQKKRDAGPAAWSTQSMSAAPTPLFPALPDRREDRVPAAPAQDALTHSAPASAPAPTTGLTGDFAEIYRQHSRAVYYLTLRWLGGDTARAEDAAHDVFLKAWRYRGSFRGDSEVRTWLYRIAINHCKTLQSAWHQRHVFLTHDGDFAETSLVDDSTPLQAAESSDLGRRIQQTLDDLPEEYRLLLLLVADEEMSYEQTAELTGQTSDAVRGKLYRARKAFAAAFRKTG
jgi:RNA polymerase sigma-70 factor (ECF subfamily)